MKKTNMRTTAQTDSRAGFTLVELLVAMAVFTILGAATVTLLVRHMPLFHEQQGQAVTNMALRNAATQIQIDTINAGSGFAVGQDFIGPFGANATPPPAGAVCFDPVARTYGAGCFDTLTIYQVALDNSAPVRNPIIAQIDDSPKGTSCSSHTASTLFANPIGFADASLPPGDPTLTAAQNQLIPNFLDNDQVLVLTTVPNSHVITNIAGVQLTKDAAISGGKVRLEHNPQGDTTFTDFIGLSPMVLNKLGKDFCSPFSWVIKLAPPIIFGVDTTDPANPKLYKQVGTNGPRVVIAEQIIGFKVGVGLANGASQTNGNIYKPYYYNSQTDYGNDFSQIRSLKISLVGRTDPNEGGPPNAFDGGPYRVESVSIVVNPRNLSMED